MVRIGCFVFRYICHCVKHTIWFLYENKSNHPFWGFRIVLESFTALTFKGSTTRFTHLEKFTLIFLSQSFVIRVNTPYSKMAAILVFFCLLENKSLLPRLRENILLNFEFKNEATRASLQVNKRILKWRPFWNNIYLLPSLTILVLLWFIIISVVFSILVNYYFQVSFNFEVILYEEKITQNTVTKFL